MHLFALQKNYLTIKTIGHTKFCKKKPLDVYTNFSENE